MAGLVKTHPALEPSVWFSGQPMGYLGGPCTSRTQGHSSEFTECLELRLCWLRIALKSKGATSGGNWQCLQNIPNTPVHSRAPQSKRTLLGQGLSSLRESSLPQANHLNSWVRWVMMLRSKWFQFQAAHVEMKRSGGWEVYLVLLVATS